MVFNLRGSVGPHDTQHLGSASRLAGGCMRGSTEGPHQIWSSPPKQERHNSGKHPPSKSSARRSIEPGSGESPERKRSTASRALTLEVSRQVRVWSPVEITHAKSSTSIALADYSGIGPGSIPSTRWRSAHPSRHGSALCTAFALNREAVGIRQMPRGTQVACEPRLQRICGRAPVRATPDGLSATSATR